MAVKHRRLGGHGVLVSNICLGTMNFGWHTSKEESFAIMDRALELGINFFDTADVYGWSEEQGRTEEIIGEWLAQGGGRRDAVVLGTKVFDQVTRRNALPEPNSDGQNLSAYKIRKHCEGSLKRLRTEWIDLYQLHHIDRDCPWNEIWPALDALQKQGKIVYTGSSNFAAWALATGVQEAHRRGLTGFVSEQSVYNLSNRMLELEMIPACRHYGVGLLPWSPLGGGLLAGKLTEPASGRRRSSDFDASVERLRPALERFEALCRELGHPPSDVALAWLLHNPVVTAPVIGPRTIAQLDSAVRATHVTLDGETLATLDDIFPGPGGEAPEAYAW